MRLFTQSVISLIVLAFCTFSSKGQVTAGFTASPTSGCAPLVVAFTNTTIPATGTTYSWNLGNGTGIITLTNPGTSYLSAGTYTVTLTATNGPSSSSTSQIITVFPSPIVNFTESDTLICPGAPVTFTSTTVAGVSGPVSYLWSFADGYTSTLASATHAYSFPGYFNITLEATNSDGCSSILTKTAFLHVRNPPLPLFSANTHICNPPVNDVFTNAVTGSGPFTYRWNFGDGSPNASSPNPVHSYTALGTYNVQLMVTDIHGCEDSNTLSSYINVLHLIASFTSPDSVCVNSPVIFTNTSSPFISKQWLYGDGAMDTNITGHHIYHTGGSDTVRLITYNNFCYDTAKRSIYVQAPVSTFTITPPIPCPAPETSVFTATVLPNSTITWNFGDSHPSTGITTPHTYINDSLYIVTMISTTDLGCKDTVIDSYTVNNIFYGIINSFPTAAGSCIPYTVYFSESITSTTPVPPGVIRPYPATFTYSWNFGDGSPLNTTSAPTHTYTAQGGFIVTLTLHSSNGCTFVCHDSIPVGIKPDVTFTAHPLHQCQDTNNITLIATTISGNPQYYYWIMGQGSYGTSPTTVTDTLSYHYLLPGLFSDTLIAYNYGCPDTFIRHDYILIDSPNAHVYPNINCIPANSVNFIDSAMGDDRRIWFFGDGTTDTTRYPSHTYSSPAVYNVIFTDYNTRSGCRDTSKFTIDLSKPVISFSTPDSAICRDGYVILHSSVISGYAGYREWFADGVSSDYNNYNFADTFHATGYYTIMLVVHDQNNCQDTTIRTNYILVAKPVANFTVTPASICLPQGAVFTDVSTDVTGTILQHFKWSFGDTTSPVLTTTPSVTHLYTATGSYTSTEIVTDNIGCSDTVVRSLANVFHPICSFIASTTSSCAFIPISFSCYSYPSVTWLWLFGDGGSSTLKNPSHAYTDSGTFTVSLIVTDVHGCTDTATMHNYIRISRPFAAFTEGDSVAFCPPFTVHFTNASTGGISNKWLFGNGDSSLAISPTNIYTVPGYDTVRLIVTNTAGCRDTTEKHVKIYGYSGAFTYNVDSGCAPYTVSFNASLTEVTGLSNITWDFSDGIVVSGTISDSVISHTYLYPGSFVPKLIINVASTGCVDTNLGANPIKVDAIAKGFTAAPNPVCINNTLTLEDTSHSYWSDITTWRWNVNGTTDSTDTAYAVFNTVGTYTVTLLVTDGWGCLATDTGSVSVITIPPITISPDSVICTGSITHFSDPTPGGIWSSNHAGIASAGSNSGIVTGITGGSAIITYGLADGCRATASVTVVPYPNPGIITGKIGVCAGDTIQLADSIAGGIWSINNGNATITSSGLLKGITVSSVTVLYTVANGQCDSTAIKIIDVYPLPNPGTISGQNMICPGAVITLSDSMLNGRWSSGDTAIATVDSITGVVKAIAIGSTVITYTTAPTPFGCFSTTIFPLNVINTDFTVNSNISQVKCFNDSNGSISLIITGGNPPFQYKWSTGSTESFITGLDTGSYSLVVTEKTTDCIVYDKIVITQPDTLQITADITEDLCRGSKGSIAATVSGGTKPYNYLWNDKQTGSTISGLLTGKYELLVTDVNGCTKQMSFTVPDTCSQIIIYDAISPNGDGINDTWEILGLQLFPANTVQLFDKWGDEVFSATNYKNDFAGKGKKGELPDGTYYYLVKLNTSNAPDGKESFTGTLLIKR